jgi:NADP-dependent 3-hydroxy acid dehydrogenase YdfG
MFVNAAEPECCKILITGATSAIGAALADMYAQRGVTLYLQGRNEVKLAEVAERSRAKGAEAKPQRLDLRDFAELQGWLAALGPLDLVIINAGMNIYIGLGDGRCLGGRQSEGCHAHCACGAAGDAFA